MTDMTTQAPPNPTQQPGAPRREEPAILPPEHETAPLEAGPVAPILDSLGLLDHRTRSRAISRRLAPFGHYLAFGDNGVDWLVPLDAKVTHIGRGLTSHVRVEEQRVSRSHAILVRHGHHTRLLDNRSANGTFVNGRQIIATNIADGDVIRIGPVVMTYVQVV
jgi:FHA domain